MSKKTIQTLKGFRDYYPENKAFINWFYENLKSVSELFGYQEYDGPTLEPLELYAAKSGEELVKKQAFTFTDKGERTVALRPEMTPTLARMITAKQADLAFPVRWFTFGKRYRYEQPQAGRGREFYQWDIDILGTENVSAEVEILKIAILFYQKIGLTPDEVKIKINDRQLLYSTLKALKIKNEGIDDVIKLIDKKEKLSGSFGASLKKLGLKESQIKKLAGILNDKKLYKNSKRLISIFEHLQNEGLSDYIEYDAQIVRGLDYYTSTVFEAWDVKGKFRSMWGGGRYDNLTSLVGSKTKIPAVGFAMGNMVLYEVLKANGKLPNLDKSSAKVLVTIFSEKETATSEKVAKLLRNANINTELYPDPSVKLQKQLKYADKKGIPYVVIIGPKEVLKDEVVLKDMKNKRQEKVSTQSLLTRIK